MVRAKRESVSHCRLLCELMQRERERERGSVGSVKKIRKKLRGIWRKRRRYLPRNKHMGIGYWLVSLPTVDSCHVVYIELI